MKMCIVKKKKSSKYQKKKKYSYYEESDDESDDNYEYDDFQSNKKIIKLLSLWKKKDIILQIVTLRNTLKVIIYLKLRELNS